MCILALGCTIFRGVHDGLAAIGAGSHDGNRALISHFTWQSFV